MDPNNYFNFQTPSGVSPQASPQPISMPPSTPKRSRFTLWLVLGILVVAIIILGIILAIVFTRQPQNDTVDTSVPSQTLYSNFDIPYLELNKTTALAAFTEMQKPNYMPENFVNENWLNPEGSDYGYALVYSYDNPEQLETDYGATTDGSEVAITTVGDYYSILTFASPNFTLCTEDCLKIATFNRSHLDFAEDQPDDAFGVFTDDSPEFVKIALPVLAITSDFALINAVYSYEFEEREDAIVLAIHKIEIGYDIEEYTEENVANIEALEEEEIPYALVVSTMRYAFDRATKTADWVYNDENYLGIIEINKILPISNAELEKLEEL